MPDDKITQAFKEIGNAPHLDIGLQDGVPVVIHKQVIICGEKAGVKKQITIDEEITR